MSGTFACECSGSACPAVGRDNSEREHHTSEMAEHTPLRRQSPGHQERLLGFYRSKKHSFVMLEPLCGSGFVCYGSQCHLVSHTQRTFLYPIGVGKSEDLFIYVTAHRHTHTYVYFLSKVLIGRLLGAV